MSIDKEWCPRQSGSMKGYAAQKFVDGKWQPITIEDMVNSSQIPYPNPFGGILFTIGLLSQAQAKALTWLYVAEADTRNETVVTRVVSYNIEYEIKAKLIEGGV